MSPIPEVVNAVVAKSLCNTITYEWTIHNFSYENDLCDKYIESSLFPVDSGKDEPKWRLRAYPKGSWLHHFRLVRLSIVSHSESNVRANATFSILDDKGEKHSTYSMSTKIFEPNNIFGMDSCFSFDYRKGNTLKTLVKVSVIKDNCNFSGQSHIKKLSDDFGTLLDNDKFSDVKLVASGHVLQAHKAILAVRSKVFAAMFEHEMEEQRMNRVSITDVDHEVLKEILRYIYTGKAPNLDIMAEGIFAAADKYDIKLLKGMCEEYLAENINIEKAANILILADRHNAEQLKSRTIEFITSNANSFMATQGWQDMRTTHSHLIEELFCAIAQNVKI